MHEPADYLHREVFDIIAGTVDCVCLEHGDDFVVCLIVVKKPQTSYWTAVYDDVTVSDILFGKYANVQRVVVSFNVIAGKGCLLYTSPSPRD